MFLKKERPTGNGKTAVKGRHLGLRKRKGGWGGGVQKRSDHTEKGSERNPGVKDRTGS